jgi:hypothetical protein
MNRLQTTLGMLSVAVVAILQGCNARQVNDPKAKPSVVLTDQGGTLPFDHPPISIQDGGLGSDGGITSSAAAQRLSIRQMAASMPVILGGDSWLINKSNGFNVRSATLGEADYIDVVTENLEASALFMKLMGDAARDGCSRAVNADKSRAQGDRIIYRFAGLTDTASSNVKAIDDNLRYLKLRFHGVRVIASDTSTIASLRTLFSDVVSASAGSAEQKVKEGWKTVCVALFSAPEYNLY